VKYSELGKEAFRFEREGLSPENHPGVHLESALRRIE